MTSRCVQLEPFKLGSRWIIPILRVHVRTDSTPASAQLSGHAEPIAILIKTQAGWSAQSVTGEALSLPDVLTLVPGLEATLQHLGQSTPRT